MENQDRGTSVWSSVLNSSNRDLKRDTNLVICGNPSSHSVYILNNIFECIGAHPVESRLSGMYKYCYAQAPNPERNIGKSDYLGVIHTHIVDNTDYAPLIDVSMKSYSLDRTLFVICIDFMESYSVMDNLNKWVNVVSERVNHYMSDIGESSREAIKQKHKERVLSFVKILDAQGNPVEVVQTDKSLPTGLLTENIGVPILVLCNNTEIIEHNRAMNESRCGYLLYHVRSLALKYGMGLACINASKRNTHALLTSYLLSLLYPIQYRFNAKAELSHKDCYFIPIGNDNSMLINDLLQESRIPPTTPVTSVFEPPKNDTEEVDAELKDLALVPEQVFLRSLIAPSAVRAARRTEPVTGSPTPPGAAGLANGSSSSPVMPASFSASAPLPTTVSTPPGQSTVTSPRTSISGSKSRMSMSVSRAHIGPAGSPDSADGSAQGPGQGDMNATSFFQSLIAQKPAGSAPGEGPIVPRKSVRISSLRKITETKKDGDSTPQS